MTRYPTRAAALAAINPAHDPWPFISYPATWNIGFAVSTCRRCHEMLAVSDSTTGRIQLTDAAHEAVCVPFGSGGGVMSDTPNLEMKGYTVECQSSVTGEVWRYIYDDEGGARARFARLHSGQGYRGELTYIILRSPDGTTLDEGRWDDTP